MPPKFKFTREEIVQAALEFTRTEGVDALTARSLAARLGCSVKPIFGLFKSMDEVRQQVLEAANALYQRYLQEDMSAGRYPAYKASGMAYIRFAREERELFRLLFMRDRQQEEVPEEDPTLLPLLALIGSSLGVDEATARRFHLEMWLYVHGIATMIATSYLNWEEAFISEALTDAYQGLRLRYQEVACHACH